MKRTPRTLWLLAFCQSVLMMGQSLVLTAAPWVAPALAGNSDRATWPAACQFCATLLTVVPAALLMKRIGRRAGFLLGSVLGIAGAVLAAAGLQGGSFVLFCIGMVFNGALHGFATYYRFAAIDAAREELRGNAVSCVLLGGVAAAFAGPLFADWSMDLPGTTRFTGSYLGLALLDALAFVALLFTQIPEPAARAPAASRPLAAIALQPRYVIAALTTMLAFATMNLLMTAAPLTLHQHHHPFTDTAFVIQWHLVGMFAPSFFTGSLVTRFGAARVMQWGATLLAGCAALGLVSAALWTMWLAMLLLGIGWNCLFVASTTLLSQAYTPSEQTKAQALNDFLVLGTITVTALSSGPLAARWSWPMLTAAVWPAVLAIVIAIAWLRRCAAAPASAAAPDDAPAAVLPAVTFPLTKEFR